MDKKIADKMHLLTKNIESYERSTWDYYLERFKRIIEDFDPDIIHVWGSEAQFGLVWKITDIPVILHLQGIINPYFNAFLPANMSWSCYGNRRIVARVKAIITKRKWEGSAYREREIMGELGLFWEGQNGTRLSHCLNITTLTILIQLCIVKVYLTNM